MNSGQVSTRSVTQAVNTPAITKKTKAMMRRTCCFRSFKYADHADSGFISFYRNSGIHLARTGIGAERFCAGERASGQRLPLRSGETHAPLRDQLWADRRSF